MFRGPETTPAGRRLVLAAVATAVSLLLLAAPASARAARPLATAFFDGAAFTGPDAPLAFRRARAAGTSWVRIIAPWPRTAPNRPANPEDPADPAYRWGEIDGQVRLAVANRLQPILNVQTVPRWAEQGNGGPAGANRPDPIEFGHFARALARRYSGSFAGLPRVQAFQPSNEPNYGKYLWPQFDSSGFFAATRYREIVNAFADGVHGVHRSNLVVAGGLGPFRLVTPPGTAPIPFMRQLLCMSGGRRPHPTCGARTKFDVWAHNPYTSGGPTHKAPPGEVSLGNLPGMRRLLRAAIRYGHVRSRRRVRFWVTEFGWDTRPPDPGAVPLKLHARWVAEALYRMWLSHVSLVTWFTLRDRPKDGYAWGDTFQTGFYFYCSGGPGCDRPKRRSLEAFRFPFVAFRGRGRVAYWGRTPWGQRRRLVVEQLRRHRWRRLRGDRSDRYGIFRGRLRRVGRGPMRARLAGTRQASTPFSLKRPPEFPLRFPFG